MLWRKSVSYQKSFPVQAASCRKHTVWRKILSWQLFLPCQTQGTGYSKIQVRWIVVTTVSLISTISAHTKKRCCWKWGGGLERNSKRLWQATNHTSQTLRLTTHQMRRPRHQWRRVILQRLPQPHRSAPLLKAVLQNVVLQRWKHQLL